MMRNRLRRFPFLHIGSGTVVVEEREHAFELLAAQRHSCIIAMIHALRNKKGRGRCPQPYHRDFGFATNVHSLQVAQGHDKGDAVAALTCGLYRQIAVGVAHHERRRCLVGLAIDVGDFHRHRIAERGLGAEVGSRVGQRSETNAEQAVVASKQGTLRHYILFRTARHPPTVRHLLAAADAVAHRGTADGHGGI